MAAVEGSRKEEVEEIAERDLAPGSNAIGDGLSCWPAVERSGRSHFPMATGPGEQATG